jgi:hypothetical protein
VAEGKSKMIDDTRIYIDGNEGRMEGWFVSMTWQISYVGDRDVPDHCEGNVPRPTALRYSAFGDTSPPYLTG